MTKEKIFLETSLQIERLLHTEARRSGIRQNLAGKAVFTSSYVLMEFQRTIIQDICYVRSVVETECEEDAKASLFLADLDRALATGKGNFSPRSAKRSRLVTAAIKDEFLFGEATRSELLAFLGFLIEQLYEEFFEIEPEGSGDLIQIECLDSTDCDLVRGELDYGNLRFHCERKTAACRLPQLMREHGSEVTKIKDAFEAAKERCDKKMVKAAERVLRSPRWDVVRGQKNCWPLGDTIIAIETPIDASIYTKDRHFEVICPIVNKVVYREYREYTPPGVSMR